MLKCVQSYYLSLHNFVRALNVAGLRRASTNRGWSRVAFVQRKVSCFGFGLLGLLWKVLVLLGKVLVLLLMVDKTMMMMMICCWELRPHCEGQTAGGKSDKLLVRHSDTLLGGKRGFIYRRGKDEKERETGRDNTHGHDWG